MWKLQQPTGQREINELHVPVGRAVKLVITSEDVIHSFFVPAFRIKKDAVPGRYNVAWFRATKPGSYHLFCAEYCGTEHSRMIGRVIVMEPRGLRDLARRRAAAGVARSPAGEKLFTELGCITCHRPDSAGRGPVLTGVFGSARSGSRAARRSSPTTAYVRESIVNPAAKVVAGYQPVMPTFQGQVERGAADRAGRLRPVTAGGGGRARPRRHGATLRAEKQEAMSSDVTHLTAGRPAPAGLPAEHYLSHGWDLKSWLLTKDHKRIGLLYLVTITLFFAIGSLLRRHRALEPAGPRRQPHVRRHLQQGLHRPRRDHGVLLPDPVDPDRRSGTSCCR